MSPLLFINVVKLLKSFQYAFKGVWQVFVHEQNMRVHVLATIVVLATGAYFNITTTEWCLVVLCIGAVFAAEAFNTAIENLVDLLHPEQHPKAGIVKDIAAGAVLIAAISAAIVGFIIFGKYFAALL